MVHRQNQAKSDQNIVPKQSDLTTHKAQPIMIMGTSSGAGKSTLAIGLCRVLARRGYGVIPFKTQNMSNNGFQLPSGDEIAKSQVIAALACGVEPTVDMNPILLKLAKGKMEVFLQGKSQGECSREEYSELKKDLWPKILESYERLSLNQDAMVLEGAGSPVEMNLKSGDMANFATALRVKTPVILVADIDRGGVFASVCGTLMLLEPEERALVKGIIINRMRGDASRYSEVAMSLEKLIDVPVLGLLPYLELKLEDEDGLVDPRTGRKGPLTEAEAEREFDALARQLEEHLDIPKILDIMGLPGKEMGLKS